MARKPGETRGRPSKPVPEGDPALMEMAFTLRERINNEADPTGFLIKAMRGDPFDTIDPETGQVRREVHSLTARTDIAIKLTLKILPDLKSLELQGAVGGGVQPGNGEAFDALVSKLGRGNDAAAADVPARGLHS